MGVCSTCHSQHTTHSMRRSLRLPSSELSQGHRAHTWRHRTPTQAPPTASQQGTTTERQGRLHYSCPSNRLSPHQSSLITPHTTSRRRSGAQLLLMSLLSSSLRPRLRSPEPLAARGTEHGGHAEQRAGMWSKALTAQKNPPGEHLVRRPSPEPQLPGGRT